MNIKRVSALIIGGGPAGAQCALWLKMLGHHPVIVEQAEVLGGLQALSPYQNHWMVGLRHQSGKALAAGITAHIHEMGIPVLFKTQVDDVVVKADGVYVNAGSHRYHADYLVIASGVVPRRDVFRESDKVLVGPGEAVYHGNFAGKRVAILGGGDNAYENQAFIMGKNPACCHVYARTKRARRNLAVEVDPAHVFSGEYRADQASMTVTYAGEARSYDMFIVLYGWEANLPSALNAWRESLLDERGFVATNAFCQTREPRFFAIGEVADRMHPCVVTAMADGVVAAKAMLVGLEGSIK
ncbi:MAG TPA: NAD(P)/FAD-dependent oxidoreductase [Gammaproteobacteria bacterium]|jgi:thioredoxin reductase (NADPH)|nr:NAD(P)/FAD-dependent oxidoreductase [Gammaproteobacteria bacterium]